MKKYLLIGLLGLSTIASAQLGQMPTMPIDPRCGQVFCPITPPPNPCTINPDWCKPPPPPKIENPEITKCIDGILHLKVYKPTGIWVWEPKHWSNGKEVQCERNYRE